MQGLKPFLLEPGSYAYKRAQTVRVSLLCECDLADLWIFLTCRWMSSQTNNEFYCPVVLLHFREERFPETYKELGAVVALTFYSTK